MHWYLIYTHCWHEKKVKKRLERERFETFLPVTERWSRRKDRQKRIHIPLFPGYLFVHTEMNATIYLKILKIKGVIGFFCNGGKPAIVPDEEVDTIQISLKNVKDVSPVELTLVGNYPNKPIYSHRLEEASLS
jgi:transcription antitermination factor NusG